MWKYYKVKIHNISEEQEKFIVETSDVYRYCYNWGLNFNIKRYEETRKYVSFVDMVSAFREFRNSSGHEWLSKYDSTTCIYAFKDVLNAFKKFWNYNQGYPKHKSRKKSRIGFKLRGERLRFIGEKGRELVIPGFTKIEGKKNSKEKIVSLKRHNIPFGKGIVYHNARISYDGISYWLSLSIEFPDEKIEKPIGDPVGIDVGIRTSAYLSNGEYYKSPKSDRLTLLFNRKESLQRAVTRDINRRKSLATRMTTKYENIPKSNNQIKREKKLLKTLHSIHNIYDNHYHQISRDIANKNPSYIVLETLKIENMVKNSIYSRDNIVQARLGTISRYIEYKCRENGSDVIKAPSDYPSTQLCSNCGFIQHIGRKKIYKCPKCGIELNRDYNASLNLLHYGEKQINC